MKHVILTVGPQCVGKSTFCNKIIQAHPEIILISRDAILMELFGKIYLDKYSGGHYIALEKMWEKVTEQLQKDSLIILDCWNDSAEKRKTITEKLRSLGAQRIDAWYFVTPENTCVKWYMKEVSSEIKTVNPKWGKLQQESMCDQFCRCYEFFHSQTVDHTQGFDFIKKIDPLETPTFEMLLRA